MVGLGINFKLGIKGIKERRAYQKLFLGLISGPFKVVNKVWDYLNLGVIGGLKGFLKGRIRILRRKGGFGILGPYNQNLIVSFLGLEKEI